MTTSWHSYPSSFALGHRALADLLLDPVTVEEKIDGSQFSFGYFPTPDGPILKMRSKGAELNLVAPEKMFLKAISEVRDRQDALTIGWTYRGEYLAKPKHNSLVYDRIPAGHIIIFDVNPGHEEYLPYAAKRDEATRLNFETVPLLFEGMIEGMQQFRDLLGTVSCLGGQTVEGVVVKNYARFGPYKKVLMGKFVSEAFKEVHSREWKAANPTKLDIVQQLIESLKTPARWNKAIQHLREAGTLEDSPRDIGHLMREVPTDIQKEEAELIKTKLYEWAWPHIRRGVVAGLPEYYKEQLLARQFESEVVA